MKNRCRLVLGVCLLLLFSSFLMAPSLASAGENYGLVNYPVARVEICPGRKAAFRPPFSKITSLCSRCRTRV